MDNSEYIKRAEKAENIRGVIRYLQKFKNATVVIYIDDKILGGSLFSSHIKDIALLHQAGLRVILVPGAKSRIDEVLSLSNLTWEYKDHIRITSEDAMPHIKMAAFDVSNNVMTALAANNIPAVIGNWVRSRAKGILEGLDFGTAGEIDRLQIDAINRILDEGFIPIFPCIGWSSNGHPYNISSVSLAQNIAISLKADKLFFMMDGSSVNKENFSVPENISVADNGDIPAMNLTEVDDFISANEKAAAENAQTVFRLLKKAQAACSMGVTRCHLVDGNIDGVLPCEIFSDLGSGTMIYTADYGMIRPMTRTDIPSVLQLMKPFVESGKLLSRTEGSLMETFEDYVVYELDDGIRACAALHLYEDGQAEIAAVAVDRNFEKMGIGPKLIKYLKNRAAEKKASSVFILTTQASDWFEKMGFTSDSIDTLPEERRKIWNSKRNSKLYRLK